MLRSSYTIILSAALIVAYMVSMILAVGPHNHFIAKSKGSQPSFVSHNCGTKEKHEDIESKDSCLPCFRSQNPVSSSTYCPFLSDSNVEHHQTDDVHATPNSVTLSHTPKRGPPSYHTI
jgi:Ca2+/H+ antiporter